MVVFELMDVGLLVFYTGLLRSCLPLPMVIGINVERGMGISEDNGGYGCSELGGNRVCRFLRSFVGRNANPSAGVAR